MEWLDQFLTAFGQILGEAGFWLVGGFVVAGFLHEFVPRQWLASQLGRKGVGSVVKGAVIGAPLPLCSCSVIPAAATLRSSGASKGAATSFAVATPEIDVPAVSLTWALLGPVMAIARVIGAAVSAVTAGLLVDAFASDPKKVSLSTLNEPQDSCCAHSNSHSHDHGIMQVGDRRAVPTVKRLKDAMRYGLVDLPVDLSGWLIVGLVLSAAVGAFLPASVLAGDMGDGPVAIVAAMGLGLVVYVCATGSTPLVAVLIAKGLGPGAALAFLLAGPATNPATMAWVLKDLGRSALVAYLGAIGSVAFLSGLGLQWLSSGGGWTPITEAAAHNHTSSALGGSLLAALLTYASVQPRLKRLLSRKPGITEQSGSCGCGPSTSEEGPCASKG